MVSLPLSFSVILSADTSLDLVWTATPMYVPSHTLTVCHTGTSPLLPPDTLLNLLLRVLVSPPPLSIFICHIGTTTAVPVAIYLPYSPFIYYVAPMHEKYHSFLPPSIFAMSHRHHHCARRSSAKLPLATSLMKVPSHPPSTSLLCHTGNTTVPVAPLLNSPTACVLLVLWLGSQVNYH